MGPLTPQLPCHPAAVFSPALDAFDIYHKDFLGHFRPFFLGSTSPSRQYLYASAKLEKDASTLAGAFSFVRQPELLRQQKTNCS